MANSKSEPSPPPPPPEYTPLLLPSQNYVVLLPCFPNSHLPRRRTIYLATLLLLLATTSTFLFWPSDPSLKIVRLRLNRIQVHTHPHVSIDVSIHVTLKVRNVDVYTMDYEALEVAVGYRGRRLGNVTFQQGHVRAFGSSYVDAEVEFNGIGVFSDVVLMLEDLAKGTVPFDTVTEVRGRFGFLGFRFPLK